MFIAFPEVKGLGLGAKLQGTIQIGPNIRLTMAVM
jgi:hypothetical protein